MKRLAAAFTLAVVASVVVATGCDQGAALVGGVCATGYTDCNDVCVLTTSDPNDCGGCGNVCSSGRCVNSVCAMSGDAQVDAKTDARTDARPRTDAGTDAADARADGTTDATLTDAGTDVVIDARHLHDVVSESSRADAASGDAKASDGALHDGHGGDGRAGDASDGSTDGPATATCTPPLFACDGICITGASDPDNCGSCGNVCLSGICVNGMCAGSTSGDIVIIGDDYATASVHAAQARVLTNAVFLPPSNPLRVLSFEQYGDRAQIATVKGVLTQAATTFGRTVQVTAVIDSTLVPGDLAGNRYDVLLVYDQADAPANTLGPVGTAWQASLATFLQAGGDVVVLDGASGAFPQMSTFLTNASLLATTGESAIATGTQLLNVASGDSVGNSVLSPFAAQADTVSFVTSEVNGGNVTYVIDELSGGALVPVVIHKTVP